LFFSNCCILFIDGAEETKKLKDRIQKLLPSYATAVETNSNKNNTGNNTTDTDRSSKKKRKSFSSVVTDDTEVDSSDQPAKKVEEPWDRDLVISYSICLLLFVFLISWFLFPSNGTGGGLASFWRSFY
jgi:hypothetical protein